MDVVDDIIIGGGMSFTFVKALGGSIGNSIHEDEMINTALDILQSAKNKNVKIHLPVDVVCSTEFSNDGEQNIFDIDKIPENFEGMDAGPKSLEIFKEVILNSKTILWNGLLGFLSFQIILMEQNLLEMQLQEAQRMELFHL